MGESTPNPSRELPSQPNWDHLKKQAKSLLRLFRDSDTQAIEEVERYERQPDVSNFSLVDAQRVVARSYGYSSWAKLKEAVRLLGADMRPNTQREFPATPAGICEAARAGDVAAIKRILSEQPQLIAIDNPHNWTKTVQGHDISGSYNKKPIEVAAFFNQPEAVSELLSFSLKTSSLQTPSLQTSAIGEPPAAWFNSLGIAHAMGHVGVIAAIHADVLALVETDPELLRDPGENKDTILFFAAKHGDMSLVRKLLDKGAEATPRSRIGHTVIQTVLDGSKDEGRREIARTLVEKGAPVPLWVATAMEDEDRVRQMLAEDPSLAKEKWQWSECYPLVRACHLGNRPIIELLLDHGADINGDIGEEDPRDFGMPLMMAYYSGRYDLVTLLLDRGASIHAHPNCNTPFIDLVYQGALKSDPDAVRSGTLGKEDDEALKLYRRVVSLGGQPKIYTMVKAKDWNEIRRLLREKPNAEALNYGRGPSTVFNSVNHAAAWLGEAKSMELCLEIQPELMTSEIANENLRSAIRSHNREGSFDDYRRIIEMNLELIKKRGWSITMRPLWLLADDFLENYRYSSNPKMPEMKDVLDLAGLFLSFGADINERDPESNHTALSQAVNEGHVEYVQFLLKEGASVNEDDPPETSPLAIAKEHGFVAIEEMLTQDAGD